MSQVADVGLVRVDLKIPIEASAARVWASLVDDTDAWWLEDYRAVPGGRLTLEAFAGGRLVEETGDKAGILWGQVIAITPGESLNLSAQLAPPYAGPATSLLHLKIVADGEERSVLEVSDSIFGLVTEKTAGAVESGWRALFGGLKSHAEG